MATTTIRSLPYPAGGDQPDGAGAFQQLAQKIEDQDPFITAISSAAWPYLTVVRDTALNKWRPWESRWTSHGSPSNYTNGANGSAQAMSKWSGGDLLLRGKIVFGSSSPALPGTLNFPAPGFTALDSGLSVDENSYGVIGHGYYVRSGVKTVFIGGQWNGSLIAAPMATQTLNGANHEADGVGWPYPNPAQSDLLDVQIRLQMKWA